MASEIKPSDLRGCSLSTIDEETKRNPRRGSRFSEDVLAKIINGSLNRNPTGGVRLPSRILDMAKQVKFAPDSE